MLGGLGFRSSLSLGQRGAFGDRMAPAYLKTLSDIVNGDQVSFFRFIPRTEHAKIRARTSGMDIAPKFREAMNALMDNTAESGALYVPRGRFVFATSPGKVGNTNNVDNNSMVRIHGDGRHSQFKTTTAGLTIIQVEGPNPDVDGAGNRFTGGIDISDLALLGPGEQGVGAKSGKAISVYGAQGMTFRNLFVDGWANGIYLQNVDLIDIICNWLIHSDYGVRSSATGYALAGAGQMNSFIAAYNKINSCSVSGIDYFGGIKPVIVGNNFVINGDDVVLSSTAGVSVTSSPTVRDNYHEGSTGSLVRLGGGGGIVRGGSIRDNDMLVAPGTTAILVANISNSFSPGGRCRIYDNHMSVSGGVGVFTEIDQSTSAEKADYNGQNGSLYEVGSTINFSKTGVGVGAAVDILKMATFGNTVHGRLHVTASSAGLVTSKTYSVAMMGGGVPSGFLVEAVENYGGGPSAFTLSETKDAPVAGTNKLTLTNNSAAVCTFDCVFEISKIVGTLSLM